VRNAHSATSTPTATRQPKTCALGRNSSPTVKLWLKYAGRMACEVLPQMRPMSPSSTSASENVSSTDAAAGASRMRRIAPPYSSHPNPNIAGVVITIATSGSRPVAFQSEYVRNAAKMRNAPWATLMTFITPKISVRPEAIRA
jgi:hypothetical protein